MFIELKANFRYRQMQKARNIADDNISSKYYFLQFLSIINVNLTESASLNVLSFS